jgi:hypothetical protein
MKKLLVATLALVLAGLFALPGVASAQDGEATVEGRGWLWARGEGTVDIDMGGRIRLHVDGDVTVTDNAGDMRIRLRGGSGPEEERATNVSLDDFRGTIHVHGSDFTVSVDGKVVLNAHGHGRAVLVGEGVYKTRHGDRMVWDGAVELGDPQLQPAA